MVEPNSFVSPVGHAFINEKGALGFAWVGGVLLFVALSGIAIWLLPFTVPTQVTVLLHCLLGLAVVIPFTLWQLSHGLAARKAQRRFRRICAYIGFWSLAVTSVAGLVLTYEAAFGLYISHFWDRIHLYSGLLAIPFVVYHVLPRAREAGNNPAPEPPGELLPDFAPARRRMWRLALKTTIALSGLVVLGSFAYRTPDLSHYRFNPKYNWAYGKENPFKPSLTTTEDDRPIPPELLASSQTCGGSGCHTSIYREWAASAHRWSSEDKFFQVVQDLFIKDKGIPPARYCGGCHDPVSLLSGYKDASTGISAPGFKEGDSCVVCHAVRRVDVQGNGNYVLGRPTPYLYEYETTGWRAGVAHFLIRAYPKQHDRDYDLTLLRRPESCGACHKQFIDKYINNVGWVQLQNQYDDWRLGKWNASPDPSHRLRCQQCHMYYQNAPNEAEADPYDLRVSLGLKHRNHYFAAGNQFMPSEIHSEDAAGQVNRVNEWLRGQHVSPEIAAIWPSGPLLPLKILTTDHVRPGQRVDLSVIITNNKVGHSFPTGPLDLIRAWIEVVVQDANSRTIFHSGELTAAGHIEQPGSVIFKAVGVNPSGQEIVRHDLWHLVGAKFKRAIFAGYSDRAKYEFRVPANASGPLTVTARLRYRKANQYFMDMVFPGQHRTAPVTDISSDQVQIALSARAAPAAPTRPGRGRGSP